MSLTLFQPLSAVSHGSVTRCFLPLLNQMGCVCCESQGQRNTERQRNEGHLLQASRAVCLVLPHYITSRMFHSIIFSHSHDKITASSYQKEKERNTCLFIMSFCIVQDCSMSFPGYLLLHCLTSARVIPAASVPCPTPHFALSLSHLPAPFTFLFLLPV